MQYVKTDENGFEPVELPYGNHVIQYDPDSDLLDTVNQELQDGETLYRSLPTLKSNLRKAQRGERGSDYEGTKHNLAEPLYVIAVASIQTPTDRWESATVEWIDGNINLREYLGRCERSGTKLKCIRNTLKTDILERVNVELRRHHIQEAVELLSGERHDVKTFLKGVKAWFPIQFMFNVGTIDTNVHTAMEEILVWNVGTEPRYHRSMSENAIGQARAKAEKWPGGKIPPCHKDWLDNRVSKYRDWDTIEEYWRIARLVLQDATDVPADAVPQLLFNVGGRMNNDSWDRTIHAPIYEALGRNLEEYEV